MKVADRFSARWQARRDRKLMKEAGAPKERLRSKLAKILKPKTGPDPAAASVTVNRADRRRALRAAGPVARPIRLHTHMRRPLRAVRCKGQHRPDKNRLAWLVRKHLRSLERAEA